MATPPSFLTFTAANYISISHGVSSMVKIISVCTTNHGVQVLLSAPPLAYPEAAPTTH